MLNSLEEDYLLGNISTEKYNNLHNRYQQVLNNLDQEEMYEPKNSSSYFRGANMNFEGSSKKSQSLDDFVNQNQDNLMIVLIILLVISILSALTILIFL